MFDVTLFGDDPGGHHLSSVVGHALTALVLVWALYALSSSWLPSLFAGFLFALHPFNVDSVAWIAERKNIVSTFFWFASTGSYARYVATRSWRWYGAALVALLLGLMAKAMLVTVPLTFLLFDYWPLRRSDLLSRKWWGLIKEKIPFFGLMAAFLVVTYRVQIGYISNTFDDLPMGLRVANAVRSYGQYLLKTVWPHDFAIFYPHPGHDISMTSVAIAATVLVGLTVLIVGPGRSRRYLAVGWCWFLGTLVPVIGLVQAGMAGMADRYAYIGLIGVFFGVSWLLWESLSRRTFVAVAMVSCVALAIVTTRQVPHWKDSETLFRHALSVTEDNFLAYNNLGTVYYDRGDRPRAREQFTNSVNITPQYADAQMNLGTVCLEQGDLRRARHHLTLAVELEPTLAEAHSNLGAVLMKQRRVADAVPHLEKALELNPALVPAQNNLRTAREWLQRQD